MPGHTIKRHGTLRSTLQSTNRSAPSIATHTVELSQDVHRPPSPSFPVPRSPEDGELGGRTAWENLAYAGSDEADDTGNGSNRYIAHSSWGQPNNFLHRKTPGIDATTRMVASPFRGLSLVRLETTSLSHLPVTMSGGGADRRPVTVSSQYRPVRADRGGRKPPIQRPSPQFEHLTTPPPAAVTRVPSARLGILGGDSLVAGDGCGPEAAAAAAAAAATLGVLSLQLQMEGSCESRLSTPRLQQTPHAPRCCAELELPAVARASKRGATAHAAPFCPPITLRACLRVDGRGDSAVQATALGQRASVRSGSRPGSAPGLSKPGSPSCGLRTPTLSSVRSMREWCLR